MNPEPLESSRPAVPATSIEGGKRYQAGALSYTVRGLLILSLWLLWGDFAFTFLENIYNRFISIYLKDFHASNSLIGVMTGSLVGTMNLFFLPNISQWSDRTRSRWGRRIPFLFVVTPLTVASLLAICFAPDMAEWILAHVLSRLSPAVAVNTVILSLLFVFVASFHFFNMVLYNAYYWLLRDVIPLDLITRFLAWFRIVGSLSSVLFLWVVFPHVLTHRKEVFLGVGFFYLVAFLLMCWNVKEGPYPDPAPRPERVGVLKSFRHYFRECLSLRIYRNFFIVYLLILSSNMAMGTYSILFCRESLGMGMDEMGKIFAWGAVASAVVYYPMGWLCDRFNPLQVALCSLLGFMACLTLGFFLIHSAGGYLLFSIVSNVPTVGWMLGGTATMMRLFPEEKFGQFSSGLNVFGGASLIFGNYITGWFMDLVHSNYRAMFLWSGMLYALALYPMLRVYLDWKRHGGPHHYVPPLPPETRA